MNLELAKLEVPKFPDFIEIESAWIEKRNKLLLQSTQIERVNSQEDYEDAEILLKKITKTSNEAEKLRKKFSKPFQDFTKKIKSMADEARQPLEEQKIKLKKLMAEFINEQERKRQEELERRIAEEEAKKAEEDPFAEPEETENQEFTELVNPETPVVQRTFSRTRLVWKFEIENPSLVPREFCSPDERKIREYINNNDGTPIPGVKVWQERIVMSS